MQMPGPGCSKSGQRYSPDKSLSSARMVWFVLSTLICWLVIYTVESVIQPLNNRGLKSPDTRKKARYEGPVHVKRTIQRHT